MHFVTDDVHKTYIWGGVPSEEDLLNCPSCGWMGEETELVGIEGGYPEEIFSGNETWECPVCRLDAGHMQSGSNKLYLSISYPDDDLQIVKREIGGCVAEAEYLYAPSPHTVIKCRILPRPAGGVENASSKQLDLEPFHAHLTDILHRRSQTAGRLKVRRHPANSAGRHFKGRLYAFLYYVKPLLKEKGVVG